MSPDADDSYGDYDVGKGKKHRRRDTDRPSAKRISLVTLLSLIPATPAITLAVNYHGQWIERGVEIRRLVKENETLKARNENYEGLLEDADDRLGRLERWQCRLGWNPPETRNVDRDCGGER